MLDLALLNFIKYYFLQTPIISLAIFNCWDVQTHFNFLQLFSENFTYTQHINLDQMNNTHSLKHRFLNNHNPRMGVFLDMNCRHSKDVLELTGQMRLFNEHYFWLLYDREANIADFVRLFQQINLSINAELKYAMPSRNVASGNAKSSENLTLILYDVYNNGYILGGKLNMTIDREIFCTWNGCQLTRYLSTLHLRTKYGQRNRQHDITIRVSTVITKRALTLPESTLQEFLNSENNTRVDGIVRFGFKLIVLLRDILQCNMSFSYTDRWSGNETHGGTVGAIVTESADITSTPFLITAARLKHVSVLTETGGFRSICMFRTPHNEGIRGDEFLKPFSTSVWLLFILFLLIAAIFLWGTFLVEFYRMSSRLCYAPSLFTTCLLSFGSACMQGSAIVPTSIGGRVSFFSLYLIAFLMYNYYTSIVVSSLLGTPAKSKIKTLGELADSNLEVGLEPLPFTFVYLNASKLASVRRFVKRKIESKRHPEHLWIPAEEGIRRVRDKPGFVYVFEASSGYSLVEKLYEPHEICDLNEVMLRSDKSLHTQVHRNSSYKELFRLRQMRMLETGVYAKHFRHWVQTRLHCFSSNFVIDVALEYAAPLFLMLLCSYFFVFIVLLFEIGHKKYIYTIYDSKWGRIFGKMRKT